MNPKSIDDSVISFLALMLISLIRINTQPKIKMYRNVKLYLRNHAHLNENISDKKMIQI